MEFVNRSRELQELESLVQRDTAVLYRLTGRRRIGKTVLLRELIDEHDGVYLFVPEGDEGRILAELRRQAAEATGEDVIPPEGWTGLFKFLERFEGRPVVFDEFQHVIERSSTAISLVQETWDTRLSDGAHKWILCGSSIGMMRRLTSGKTGALFGRLTKDRRLGPFDFKEVALLYPDLDAEEILTRYAVFGGTPHYHTHSVGQDLRTAVHESFLDPAAPFKEEPFELLRYELKKPARYHGILEAIGNGNRELEEIKDYLSLERVGDITRYMGYLRDELGLLTSDEPLPTARRAQRYRFKDPFFTFYYATISKNLPMLELGGQKLLWRKIDRQIPALEGRVAEQIVHQMLIRYNGEKLDDTPIAFEELGRWWGPIPGDRSNVVEVDVVAIGPAHAIVGEVKWRNRPVGAPVWTDLNTAIELMDLPSRVDIVPLVVSKTGFTDHCLQKAPDNALTMDADELLDAVLG